MTLVVFLDVFEEEGFREGSEKKIIQNVNFLQIGVDPPPPTP